MTDEMDSLARRGITDIWKLVGSGPIASLLVCDDRPPILHRMLDMLRPLPDLIVIDWVADGFALVDAVTTQPVDLVLVGV